VNVLDETRRLSFKYPLPLLSFLLPPSGISSEIDRLDIGRIERGDSDLGLLVLPSIAKALDRTLEQLAGEAGLLFAEGKRSA
jgi:hypothetical protein